MGLFKTAVSTILRGDTEPIKDYQRNSNFLSACIELRENYGYEILYLKRNRLPIKVGKLKHLDKLSSVELEVCLAANFKVIIINNDYQPHSPFNKLEMDGIASGELLKKYFIAKIDPIKIDGYGSKVSNSFDFLRWIERERAYLEGKQKDSGEDFSSIAKYIDKEIRPYLQTLITSSDERDF